MMEKMSTEEKQGQTLAQEYHLQVETETLAIDLLADASGMSKAQLKQAMQKGAAWYTRGKHTQHLRRAKKTVQPGDELHLYYDEKVLNETAVGAELIADEGDYSVWYKPYGMRSQGSKWGDHTTVHRWAESHLLPQRNAFLVHRLDRAASGLILIAHSKTMAATLSEMFKQRKIDKRYKVIVHGQPTRAVMRIESELDDKSAISKFTLIDYDQKSDCSLLEVKIETGRKHQIRRHLSAAGLPVVGDRLYGTAEDERDLQLVAVRLAFTLADVPDEKVYQLSMDKQPRF